MNEMTIARRYAQALYQEVQAQGVAAEVDRDMDALLESLEGSRELTLFFGSPLISREKKEAVVQRLFKDRMHPVVVRLMRLLIDKGREGLLPDVVKAYRALRNERLGITEAEARVAIPLSAEEQRRLEQSLAALTGKQIRLRVQTDPALIGGAVVRVGDTVYDGSVRRQLAVLREQLERGAFRN